MRPTDKPWTDADIRLLTDLIEKQSSMKLMMKKLDRSENSIRSYMTKNQLHIARPNADWTDEEIDIFTDEWTDTSISNKSISRKHGGRTIKAIQQKACALGLGSREQNLGDLTISDICDNMDVSYDVVNRWIKKGLLRSHPGPTAKRKYLVDMFDMMEFLEANQNLYNAAKMNQDWLWIKEPNWLYLKRIKDQDTVKLKTQYEWTNTDDLRLVALFEKHTPIKGIAKQLNRTECAIKSRLYILGYNIPKSNAYTDEEIDIIKKYSTTKTIEEILPMLNPHRTESGVIYKCKMLGIPYHTSKSRI